MALLGVYEEDSTSHFKELKAVHFNLWIVQKTTKELIWDAIYFRGMSFYKYFADVGLRIEVGDETISEIGLHLPAAKLVTSSFCDLEKNVLDEETNDLIFGRQVVSRNNTISYTRQGESVCDIVHGISKIVETDSPDRFRATLKSAITGNGEPTTAYLRFRYPIPQKNDIISPIGWGFAKKGFTFDVRLNDYREVLEYRGQSEIKDMKSGEEANIFIIHPATYAIVTQSPEPHYARLLEPKVWENYLSSCEPFAKKKKFIITQWNSRQFTHEKPFRVFAQLHKEFGTSVAFVYFVGILTVPFLNGLFHLFSRLFE